MNNSSPKIRLEQTYLSPDVRLWKPAEDVLHSPEIEPQNPGCDEVFLGLPLGECGGVQMANNVIEKLSGVAPGQVYGNHQPTHGADATARFEAQGARFGLPLEVIPRNSPFVISAHGAAPSVGNAAREQGLTVYDVTCPLVHKTHRAISDAASVEGGQVVAYISFGQSSHPELVSPVDLLTRRLVKND